jgi:hypothetical protein
MPRKDRTEQFLDPSTEALLAEHERVSGLYLYNADIGEKRTSLYLTLISVGSAVFLGMVQFGVDRTLLLWSAVGFLAVVLLVGSLTFQRLIERRIRSTQYLRAVNRIHCYFAQKDPAIRPYYSWPPCDDVPSFVTRVGVLSGLRDVVAVLNSLFAGATFAVIGLALGSTLHLVMSICLGGAGAMVAWFLQQRHEARKLAQAETESAQYVRFPRDEDVEQASFDSAPCREQ